MFFGIAFVFKVLFPLHVSYQNAVLRNYITFLVVSRRTEVGFFTCDQFYPVLRVVPGIRLLNTPFGSRDKITQ